MTKKIGDVLIVGDANVDLQVLGAPELELGTERLAEAIELTLGGSSGITAFNLARLGPKVGLIGAVGRDPFGRFVEERLTAASVDLTHLRRLRDQPTGATIWHLRGARRAGVTVEGAIAAVRARDVPAEYLAGFRHLHVGAYFLLKALQPGAAALFKKARKLGLTTSLDTNYDPSERWDSGLREVLRHTDVFFPNDDEAKRMTGCAGIRDAARELLKLARIVVVKRGARGVLVASADGFLSAPARKVAAVDRTGAGDSFNAGFLSRYIEGASLEECARAGIEAGARCVTKLGGTTAFE